MPVNDGVDRLAPEAEVALGLLADARRGAVSRPAARVARSGPLGLRG